MCSCNEKQVALYCQDHNDVVCSDCKALNHRRCTTSPIDEESKHFDIASTDSTVSCMNELRDKVTALRNRREKDLKSLKEMANMCRDEVRSFREEINSELDRMEESTLGDIDEYERKEKEVIEEHIKTCSTGVYRLESSGRTLEESKSASINTNIFIYNLQLSKVIDNLSTIVDHINKEASEPEITFVRRADWIKSSTFILGEVKCKSLPKQRKAIADMKIASSTAVSVTLSSDKNPMITGALFLPTDELFLCDNTNRKIKLLDRKLILKEHIQLDGSPWDVSNYDNKSVIITRPGDKMLQFIRVSPTLESGQSVKLDKSCYGVAFHRGHIYVSFKDGEVSELDQSGITKRSIGQTHREPLYLTVSAHERMYIATAIASKLLCWSLEGKQIFEYTDSDLKSSLGMYLDSDGSTLVCGRLSNNVHLVDKNGKKLKIILSTKDGIRIPYTVSYRLSDQTLVVSCCAYPYKLLAFKLQ